MKPDSALRRSEERARLIVENVTEYAIFTADVAGLVTSWNVGAERLLGYAEGEILGKSAEVIFTEEDRANNAPAVEMKDALEKGRAADERWHVRKDGSRFFGSGYMMPVRDDEGAVVELVKILRDETELRMAQQQLAQSHEELRAALEKAEKAQAQAEEANRAKDHFLAILSHELRTPLTPVLMAAHVMAQDPDLPEEVVETFEMIQRNVQLEVHFIEDLLDLTRIARRKLEVDLAPLDVHGAVQRAVEISRRDIEARKQKVVVALEAERHRVLGDGPRLQQTVWNLLKNASKFSPDGGAIRVSTRNEHGRVLIEVSDNGRGIDAEALPNIFEAFQQGSDRITREYGGLGLGLSISKAAIEAHGGSIHATSAGAAQGSCFVVALPLLEAAP